MIYLLETENKAFSKEQKVTLEEDHSELKENPSSLHDHLFDKITEISLVYDEFAYAHSKQSETYAEKNHVSSKKLGSWIWKLEAELIKDETAFLNQYLNHTLLLNHYKPQFKRTVRQLR